MLDAIKIQKFSIDPDDFDNGLWVSAVTDLVGNSGYSRITLKELGMSATQREIAEREAQKKATEKEIRLGPVERDTYEVFLFCLLKKIK